MVESKVKLQQQSLFGGEPDSSVTEKKPETSGGAQAFAHVTLFGESMDVAPVRKISKPKDESGPVSKDEEIIPANLDSLRAEVMKCEKCILRKNAKGVVFGEGNPNAKVMLIGEAPGATEDETGRPFVGRAGQLLDLMLKSAGFKREDVFIANIVKCRPPNNRLPFPDEVEACVPHLKAQISMIRPRIIVLLGALSSQTLVSKGIRVTRDRGKWFEKDGISYLVTYHPAAVLRDENNKKKPLWDDFQSLKARYEALGLGREVGRKD